MLETVFQLVFSRGCPRRQSSWGKRKLFPAPSTTAWAYEARYRLHFAPMEFQSLLRKALPLQVKHQRRLWSLRGNFLLQLWKVQRPPPQLY